MIYITSDTAAMTTNFHASCCYVIFRCGQNNSKVNPRHNDMGVKLVSCFQGKRLREYFDLKGQNGENA